tara:strand:- start:41 stop:271 length:231 start_codon:yes stop_codon:yes gene_type:complete
MVTAKDQWDYNQNTGQLTKSKQGSRNVAMVQDTDSQSDRKNKPAKGTMGDLLRSGDLERAMPGGKKRPGDHRSASA